MIADDPVAIHHTHHDVDLALALAHALVQGVVEIDPTHHMERNLIEGVGSELSRQQVLAIANLIRNQCMSLFLPNICVR